MFIEHEAGELASILERGQVPAGSQKNWKQVNTCYSAGAKMKGVNEDKSIGRTTRVKDLIVFIVLHDTNSNDSNGSVVT